MNNRKLLLLPLIISLSACTMSGNFSWNSHKNNATSMNAQSSKFKKYKLYDANDDSIEATMNNIDNLIRTDGLTVTINRGLNELYSKLNKIFDSYIIATTKYYASSDRNYQQKAEKYYNLYNSILSFAYSLDQKIYENGSESLKTWYFGDISDEEIREKIEGSQKAIIQNEYNEKFTLYQNEGSELYNEYLNTGDAVTYLKYGYNYFLRYIDCANEFVNKIGEDNYLTYSYKADYSRDYTYQDALKVCEYVKEYFVPILKEKKVLDTPSDFDESLFNYFNKCNFCNNNTDSSELFQSYAEELGGSYLAAYNKAFKSGYYCFSDSPYSLSTAYQWQLSCTDDSVLYFSRNYQDVVTVIHEFGHYYSTQVLSGANSNNAYDILETYSQGNEFTFLNYVLEQKKDDPLSSTYEHIANNALYEALASIINEAYIAEIECFAYTTPDLTEDTLMAGVESIAEQYQGTVSPTYFMAPCISSPCYYISYATSAIEALQFLDMPFADAKACYKKLVETKAAETIDDTWKNAGLSSPFEEDTYKKVAEKLKAIAGIE